MFLFALVYTAGTVSGMYGRGFGFLTFAILLVILIAECVATKGSFSGVRCIVVLLILISSAVFATAQFRYTSVEENRDSYMQYMTDEKSVIVWGKIYKTEYKLSYNRPDVRFCCHSIPRHHHRIFFCHSTIQIHFGRRKP